MEALKFKGLCEDLGVSFNRTSISKALKVNDYEARSILTLFSNLNILDRAPETPIKKIKKRILLAGDFHCGHVAGLTPPEYQINEDPPRYKALAAFQRESYLWFYNQIERLKPFHSAFYNGDLIDGRGERSGGSELTTTDRSIQADIAVSIIRQVNASHNYITYGTPYHTGNSEDYELLIAKDVDATIASELNVNINNVIFNVKHKVGGSGTPYGNATPLLKAQLWQKLWADKEERQSANYVVRSHMHRYVKLEIAGDKHAMVLPALQGAMSKYGQRQCEGNVDFGFGYVDIYSDGDHRFFPVIMNNKNAAYEIIQG